MKPIINMTRDGFLQIEHPALGPQKTRLSADVAADATSSTVDNQDNFAANDYIVFGKPGQEKAEIVLLTSVTAPDTLGHTTGPVFAHSARDPVSEIAYNQAKIYTATSETGTYSELATVDLLVDQERTIYDANAQTSTTWFKVKYYNSNGASTSDYSDPVVFTGYGFQTLHSMTNEVMEEYGDPDAEEITRTVVRRKLRAGVRKITREMIKTFPDYNRTYTTQDLTADTATYDLPTRFLAFFKVTVNFSGTNADDAYRVETFESEAAGHPDTTYEEIDPRIFFRDAKFGIRPTPDSSSGRAFLWYWYYPEEMTEENDTHGLPYGARDLLVTYALYKLWLPNNAERAAAYKAEFDNDLYEYIEFVGQRRQSKTPLRVFPTFGYDLYDDAPVERP